MAVDQCAEPCMVQYEAVQAGFVAKAKIQQDGDFQSGLRFTDKAGEHVVVLTAKDVSSHKGADRNRIDSHQVYAASYRLDKDTWKREWIIRDGVECPELDSEAVFLLEGLTVTDLNQDQVAEVTVPYRKFCGGGVDSKEMKVIMRTGEQKFALRGQSMLVIPGQETVGGEHKADAVLVQPRYKAFREHLEKIWQRVATEHIGQ